MPQSFPEYHEAVWKYLRPTLPKSLNAMSVLDVGTNAGYFAMKAKLLGVEKVVGIESVDEF